MRRKNEMATGNKTKFCFFFLLFFDLITPKEKYEKNFFSHHKLVALILMMVIFFYLFLLYHLASCCLGKYCVHNSVYCLPSNKMQKFLSFFRVIFHIDGNWMFCYLHRKCSVVKVKEINLWHLKIPQQKYKSLCSFI